MASETYERQSLELLSEIAAVLHQIVALLEKLNAR